MKARRIQIVSTLTLILFAAAAAVGLLRYRCYAAEPETDSLDSGLILYLSFDAIDEISGQKLIIDESGLGNHGTLLSGKIGNALYCSAINKADGVRIKDNDTLDADAVTIAAWIKTEQIDGQWNRILDKGWKEGYNLCIGGDYKGETWYRSHSQLECAGAAVTSKMSVVDNQWHWVVGTYDGQTVKLYIDGKQDVERKSKKPIPMKPNDVDIMIGRLAVPEPVPYDHAFFDGMIDEVRLYNRVLSDAEIAELYQNQQED